MGYRSSVTCIMYAVKQTHKADTEAGQNIVNAWLKQRIPDFKEMNGLDLHSYFEFDANKAVFKVEDWKWYPDYPEIKALEDLFKEFADTFCSEDAYAMEFIRIGEDWTDVEAQRHGNYECRLNLHRTIYIDRSSPMSEENHSRPCIICGSPVAHGRWALGYKTCMPCGEAASVGIKRCVVPMHKSNYVMVTDITDLQGINNKGGLVK